MADEEVKTMSENIVEGYQREAVQKGLELKAQRENEDALIALAEAYLASLEPPPPEPEEEPEVDDPTVQTKKEPDKKPELHKK